MVNYAISVKYQFFLIYLQYMKKTLRTVLFSNLFVLFFLSVGNGGVAVAQSVSKQPAASATKVVLPAQSSSFDVHTAETLLDVCSQHYDDKTHTLFTQYGYSIIIQKYYDKRDDDITHTSAFTLGKGTAVVDGVSKEAFLLVVRGTNGSEWYSNFDFAPSHNNDTTFAESFLFSAEDIFLTAHDEIEKRKTVKNPIIIICGHSRGAACANILGVLFDALYAPKNVYVYTFATPATVRGEMYDAQNIFNVLNPCDIVPKVPLASWQFARAGKDIVLDADAARAKELDDAVASLYSLAPDITSYYTTRHSVTGAGISEDGLTVYEVMLLLSGKITSASSSLFSGTDFNMSNGTVKNNFQNTSDMNGALQLLSVMTASSDYALLILPLQKLAKNNGSGAKDLLNEHMPATYMTLLKKMEQKSSTQGER